MIRDLLVHVDASRAGRRRVQFAADLAVRTGARLSGIHVTPPAEVPPRYKPRRIAQVAADLSSQLALDAQAAATAFSEEATGRLADACWFEAEGDVAQGISNRSRYGDLVILEQYEWQASPETHPLWNAHSVVLRCGRPVLVVPALVQSSSLARIAVAWDGSREAVRAVHDAWPLFCQSQTIQIVVMIPPSAADNEVDAERLLAHLAKHGVGIEADVVRIKTEEEHDSLRKQLEQGRYDLLVMGLLAPPVVRIYLRRTLPVRSLVGENPGACFPLAQDQARAVL